MFFRALTMFHFPRTLDLSGLDEALTDCALKPVGPMELSSRGFVPPMGFIDSAMSQQQGHAIWITVGGEDRILPPAVIDKALLERLNAIRDGTGRQPGGRARKRLREDVIAELLPRSHVRPSRVDALLDLERSVIAVDTGSRRAAESVVSEVRRALGSFPALPLNAEVPPRAVMTGWVAGDDMPGKLRLGEDCEIRDNGDAGSKVRCYSVELRGQEVAEHLQCGRQITRLALGLGALAEFELDECLVVRKLQLLDAAIDALSDEDRGDAGAEMQARFALMAGVFGRLFDTLEAAFRISRPED